MSEYRLKTGKLGEKVVKAYKRTEELFVSSYKKIEIAFVDRFLEKAEDKSAREHSK